jgi:hypothetical protein
LTVGSIAIIVHQYLHYTCHGGKFSQLVGKSAM